MTQNNSAASHFLTAGEDYAKYRPSYPAELVEFIASQCARHNLAVDVGCGNGQFSTLLASHFQQVLAIDVSASQIENAVPVSNIRFSVEPAEQCSAEDASVNLIVAAQAAHWFDLPRFYKEVRRVAAPDCLLALVSYGVLAINDSACNTRFRQFYHNETRPYWPPERQHVDNGYTSIDFPFQELDHPQMTIEREWTLEQFLGYVRTWSTVKAAAKAGKQNLMESFADQLASPWGDPQQLRKISWPIAIRLGRV